MSRFVHFFVWSFPLFCLDLCTLCEAAEERSLPISLRVTGGSSHPDTAARSSDDGDDDEDDDGEDDDNEDDEDGGDGQ